MFKRKLKSRDNKDIAASVIHKVADKFIEDPSLALYDGPVCTVIGQLMQELNLTPHALSVKSGIEEPIIMLILSGMVKNKIGEHTKEVLTRLSEAMGFTYANVISMGEEAFKISANIS
jgi:hypothetical protein